MKRLLNKILSLFTLNLTQIPAINFIGSISDPASLQNVLASLAANSQSSAGGVNYNTSASATITLTALGNLLQTLTVGSACTVTIDAAYNIVPTLPSPQTVGQKFTAQIAALGGTTVAQPTLLATDVTLSGTTSVVAAAMRFYQGVITQLTTQVGALFTAGTTFTSIAQVGTSNLFTVTLGTNAISPTVGTLIYLNVTTGTLPSGWYPIVTVSSATSFVIATPKGQVWTATAATVGSGNAPVPVYAPLVTITGLYSAATATVIA